MRGREHVHIRLRPSAALALLFLSAGCAAIPPGTAAVNRVIIQGNRAIPSADIEEKIATTPSPKFLGLFRGFVHDYELFDSRVLQRDLERVERYYRARGYYEAHVRVGRVRYTTRNHVEITIVVDEGRPVLIHEVELAGLAGLSSKDARAVREAMTEHLKTGHIFEEAPFQDADSAMQRTLTDRGYAWAKVERRADVDLPAHSAELFFVVHPGPKATFGPVRIEGLGELPEAPVRRALDISSHEPYSTRALKNAQQAVLNLGTFSSVELVPELAEPPPHNGVVPLLVRVQPQKLKSLMLGAGLELDSIRTEIHVRAVWENKNLLGGFRHFTVDFRPGVDLFPTRIPTFEKPRAFLLDERLRLELRSPGVLEARTNGVLRQELNTYPMLLLSPVVDPDAPVLGYLEYKGSMGLDRSMGKLFGALSYSFQYDRPFSYSGTLDSELGSLVLSYVDLFASLDLRDNRMKPHQGVFFQNDVQLAGLGGDARDVRVQPEVRGYLPLGKDITLAARATVGFLFPLDYGNAVRAARGDPPVEVDRAAWNRDLEIIYLRGFFSGGPSSNRGYPLRGIGPHGVVPFFSPELHALTLAKGCQLEPTNAARCAVPTGGLSLWEASLELRFPIHGPVSGATFCDAGDVSAQELTLRFGYPHLSCGVGLRYQTPIGPVRLDVGYRIPGAQMPGGADPRFEVVPGTIFGVPMAFAFGIGEAF